MALLQKITRPRVRILGTEYSPRIVGLHNRLRAHTSRLHMYKDIRRLGRSALAARGAFVAGRRRLVIYLRPGAPEATVAHEILHAILYTEGFLPLRCRKDDLQEHPALGLLAQRLNDLLVHAVIFARVARAGLRPTREEPDAPASSAHRPAPAPSRPHRAPSASRSPETAESRGLLGLARAVAAAEGMHRAGAGLPRAEPASDPADGEVAGLRDLARALMVLAPWDERRTALNARVRAASLLARLEEAGRSLYGIGLDLPGRILLPAMMTRRRLLAPARAIFEVRASARSPEVVLVVFRPDGSACSARPYASAERAAHAVEAVRREMETMSARQFLTRHHLEYLLIEGGRRYRPLIGGAGFP